MREQCALLSADAGSYLHDDVALIVRVLGQEQDLELFIELRHALLCLVILLLRKLLELRVTHELLGILHGLIAFGVLPVSRDNGLELFHLAHAFGVRRGVGVYLAVFHAHGELGISVIQLFEFIQHIYLLYLEAH